MKRIVLADGLLVSITLVSLLGQWQRWATPLGQVSVYEGLMLIFVLVMVRPKAPLWRSVGQSWLGRLGVSLFVWLAAVTCLNSWLEGNGLLLQVGLSYLARLGLYAGFWLALAVYLQQFPTRQRWVTSGVGAWLLGQLVLGLGQYLIFPDTRWLYYLGWDDHLNRAMGTLLDPGFFGLLMVLGAIFSFDRYLQTRLPREQMAGSIAFAAFVLAVALSFSRASYVAYIGAFLAYAWLRRQRTIWLAIPLLILAILLVPKDGGGEGQKLLRTRSIEARQEVLSYHAQEFGGRDWVIGKGWYYEGALQLHQAALGREGESDPVTVNHAQAVDNTYLHVLLSAGVPGALLLGAFVVLLLRKLRAWPLPFALLVATLVHSLFSTALLYPWILLLMGSLLVAFFVGEKPGPKSKGHHT